MNRFCTVLILLSISLYCNLHGLQQLKELPFVIVIASYNNSNFVEKNLQSVAIQDYKNYRVIYINDCSSDDTETKALYYIEHYQLKDRTLFISNAQNKGALENQYYAIHSCSDNEIIVILDGDDCLSGPHVLKYLNKIYSKYDIWLTYGQFLEIPSMNEGFCSQFPDEIIKNNLFRKYQHIPSHLRSFYAWLFKKIQLEDLTINQKFLPMTGDMAAMIPMIEMASNGHFRFVNKILYLYNTQNPISDHVKSRELQQGIDYWIRSRKAYAPL